MISPDITHPFCDAVRFGPSQTHYFAAKISDAAFRPLPTIHVNETNKIDIKNLDVSVTGNMPFKFVLVHLPDPAPAIPTSGAFAHFCKPVSGDDGIISTVDSQSVSHGEPYHASAGVYNGNCRVSSDHALWAVVVPFTDDQESKFLVSFRGTFSTGWSPQKVRVNNQLMLCEGGDARTGLTFVPGKFHLGTPKTSLTRNNNPKTHARGSKPQVKQLTKAAALARARFSKKKSQPNKSKPRRLGQNGVTKNKRVINPKKRVTVVQTKK